MKLTPFQSYLRSLLLSPGRFGYLPKEEALRRLREITGVDLGDDVERWRQWGREHPEISGSGAEDVGRNGF